MSFELPKISIITPTYNQAGYIEQTINSVLSQNYPCLEYIVIDGGSTDGTLDILRKYENQLFWISEKDHGQSHAINKGLQLVSGKIFGYLNSDDLYEPDTLKKVSRFFMEHPDAFWVTGKCHIIDHKGKEIRKLITLYKNFWLFYRSYKILRILDFISQPATFWRVEVISKIGCFNESLDYTMDYDFSLRLSKYYHLWVLRDYLAKFRVHPYSKSRSFSEHFRSDLEVAKKHNSSQLLISLHSLHNRLIVCVYELLSAVTKN